MTKTLDDYLGPKRTKSKVQRTFYIDQDIHDWICAKADKHGCPPGVVVRAVFLKVIEDEMWRPAV